MSLSACRKNKETDTEHVASIEDDYRVDISKSRDERADYSCSEEKPRTVSIKG